MHAREHEERLAALLAGELEGAAPGAPPWLAECATCRARWEALQGVAARIEGAAAAQRERVAELARMPREADEPALAAALVQLAAAGPAGKRRPRRALFVAAAAAAVLCLGAWLAKRFLRPAAEPVWLDTEGLVLLRPQGEVDSFEVFEWSFGLEAESFTLVLFQEDENGTRTRLHREPKWREKTWRPTEELRAKLGRRIVWELTAYDDQGGILDSRSASASLSSR